VNLDDVRASRVDFVSCRFEDTTFGERAVGLIEGCAFVDCVFSGGCLDHVTFAKSTFRRCTFERIRARKARWQRCVLETVTLSGTLESTHFLNNSFKSADFSAADLLECAILDSSDSDLKLPDRPTNFVVSPTSLIQAQTVLNDELEADAFANYKRLAEAYAQLGPIVIVSEGLFDQLAPRDREAVMATLYRLREQTASRQE
jgi:uncharacterized protein YjbI with pentapeptide repeats